MYTIISFPSRDPTLFLPAILLTIFTSASQGSRGDSRSDAERNQAWAATSSVTEDIHTRRRQLFSVRNADLEQEKEKQVLRMLDSKER